MQLLAGGVERFLVRDALARELIGVTACPWQHAAAGQRLDGLGPEPVALARESHVAIVHLLAHRHGEGEAEPFDEILLVVAVENDGVDQAHGLPCPA